MPPRKKQKELKNIKYRLIIAPTPASLEVKVNEYIKDGYFLMGGVSSWSGQLVQAVLFDEVK